MKRAEELDPLSSLISGNVAYNYLLKNDLNSAIEQCQRTIELDPSYPGATPRFRVSRTSNSAVTKRQTTEFQKAVELSGQSSQRVELLRVLLRGDGEAI